MSTTKDKYSPDALNELRKQVQDHKASTGQSWDQIYRKTGISKSTLQAFAAGTYQGNNQNVASEVERWFRTETVLDLFSNDRTWTPQFVQTKTADRVTHLLNFAMMGKAIMVMGDPGVGKTQILDNFTEAHQHVWKVVCSPSRSSAHEVLQTILGALKLPVGKRNIFQMSELIREHFRNRTNVVLILDEVQHASEKALEELRAIQDDTGCGIAYVGNRQVARNIEGNRTANFAQRYSRIAMRHTIDSPHKDDVSAILKAWDVEDAKEIKFLSDIALRPGGGALRSLTMTLQLANMIARDLDGNAERTLEHIQNAWSQLSAGAIA